MSLVGALLYKDVVRCIVVGCSIDGILNGSGIAIAVRFHNGIEAIHFADGLTLGILGSINLSVSHTIQEHLQIGVATDGELSAIRGIVGI